VACEFGGTAVTSSGADDAFGFPIGPSFAKASDEVVFCDQGTRGFVLLTLTREAVKAEMMGVSTITSKAFTTKPVKTYRVTADGTGVSGLKEI
jgi:alkaline phosphatase D